MASITDLQTTTTGVNSRTIINDNFDELNTKKVERDGSIPMTGKLTFSGTDHAGIRLQNLTTAQRDALTPAVGDKIYNTTTGQEETYDGTTWVAPTGASDASETVKGVVEMATDAEVSARTETGGTGAALAVPADSTLTLTTDERAGIDASTAITGSNTIITNDDTANDATANAVARYDANGDMIVPTSPTDSDAAVSKTYADNGDLALYGSEASDTTQASAPTTRQKSSDTNYTKVKEVLVRLSGTVRVTFDLRRAGADVNSVQARVYVNGSAVGTERSTTSATFVNYSEDFSIEAGDLVQLYYKSSGAGDSTVEVEDFLVLYDIAEIDTNVVNTD